MTRYYQIETAIRKVDEDSNTMKGWSVSDSNVYPYEFEPNEYYPTPSSVLELQKGVYNIKEIDKKDYETFEKMFEGISKEQDELNGRMASLQGRTNLLTEALWSHYDKTSE